MWMPHYNANTINKESYPREIWIGYNIELAEQVYLSHMSKDGLGFNFDRIIIIINRIINHFSNMLTITTYSSYITVWLKFNFI